MMRFIQGRVRSWATWIAGLGLGLSVAACGGESLVAGVGSGGTGSFASGPITGFASVIVNGIRYDNSQARVIDSEGVTRSAADLKLGMMVEIEGSALTTEGGQPRGSAELIRYRSEMIGPIESRADGSLTVLGQTVKITASTVFQEGAGPASLEPGQIVEVYGLAPGAQGGSYTATRIERREGVDRYRLTGVVSDLDPGTLTFSIGGARVSYEAFASTPVAAELADGRTVRVGLLRQPRASDGVWVADRLQGVQRVLPDRDQVEIEGLVTAFESAARFSVDGIPVDASTAAFDGDPSAIRLGVRVEVEGALRGGVLIAREIEIEDDDGSVPGDGGGGTPGAMVFLSGTIESWDAASRSFLLRGIRVRFDDSTGFDDGSASDIADGVAVEVSGRLDADGSTVFATEIEFD
jgi:hypothetical protein